MSKLTHKIRAKNQAGKVALVPFLPAGYPDKERFFQEIEALDKGGADIIEIGMPFSDPVADGPTVERASLACLERGVNLAWILEELAQRTYTAGLVLMGYLNPVYQYGYERYAKDAARAGVSGIIIADLSMEESGPLKQALGAEGLSLIPLVGLNTPRERMERYAEDADAFVYFVSVLGITGARASLPPEVKEKLTLVREVFEVPVALGFGLKHPDQLKELEGLVDAAVFGSALINHIDQGSDCADFMKRWT
ncbi:MAG: tryptophan synthase subunit alpha [Desulfovibrionaceae bacterium]